MLPTGVSAVGGDRLSRIGTTSSPTSRRRRTASSAAPPGRTPWPACRWTRSSTCSAATTACGPAAATTWRPAGAGNDSLFGRGRSRHAARRRRGKRPARRRAGQRLARVAGPARDVLAGGAGHDILAGGDRAPTSSISQRAAARDVIAGFPGRRPTALRIDAAADRRLRRTCDVSVTGPGGGDLRIDLRRRRRSWCATSTSRTSSAATSGSCCRTSSLPDPMRVSRRRPLPSRQREHDIPSMSLPPGFLDELRSSRLARAGRRPEGRPGTRARATPRAATIWAPCPFHQEKTASFHVDEAKGYYYCFGCHAKGDAVSFVRETENLGFIEAVELLAREAGMPMPARDPADAAQRRRGQGLVEAMEAAVQFYRLQLSDRPRRRGPRLSRPPRRSPPPPASASRSASRRTPAPALLEHLTAKGFARERLVEAGLVGLPREGGSAYDRFRGRIMFPIRDARGRAIAFGARAIAAGQEPKYLNSPDTPLFDKGRTLYNVGPARAAAGRAGTVIVAEGYMDVIALAQAGLEHAVAPLGTAITEAQLELLWKLAPEPVVALDGDAGRPRRRPAAGRPRAAAARPRPLAALRADAARPGSRRRGPRRRRRARCGAARRLAADRRPALGARDRAARCSTAPSAARRSTPPARASRPHRRPGPARALGSRGPQHAAPRSSRRRRVPPVGRHPPACRSRGGGRGAAAVPPRPRSSPGRPTAPPPRRASARARSSTAASTTRGGARAWRSVLERLEFRCADLGKIRDALLSALGESPHEPHTGEFARTTHADPPRLRSAGHADGRGPGPCEPALRPGRRRGDRRAGARRGADAPRRTRRASRAETREAIGRDRRRAADEALTCAPAQRDRRRPRDAGIRTAGRSRRRRRGEASQFETFLAESRHRAVCKKPRRR